MIKGAEWDVPYRMRLQMEHDLLVSSLGGPSLYDCQLTPAFETVDTMHDAAIVGIRMLTDR